MTKPPAFSTTGFEAPPCGRLLQQVVEYSGDLGVAYERCIGYSKPKHSHDRVAITFARGSSRFEMRQAQRTYLLDAKNIHWMAAGQPHEQHSLTTVYDTLGVYPTAEMLRECADDLGLPAAVAVKITESSALIDRTPLLADAFDRYFYHRITSPETPAALMDNLGRQLIRAVLASLAGVHQPPADADTGSSGDDLDRALAYIETHLFEKLSAASISKSAKLSQATLFRRFKDVLQTTPLAYVRARRLDEAEALLQTGKYTVSDVVYLVGYEDLSAFSKVFKQRFGRSPSTSINRA